MAVLDRLSIQGIRSFQPDKEEKVIFSTPLTLFLGQNGCGKTTIIECIKFALTGELPAGTENGKGFINDPKLSNKNSTKAAIKLRFKDFHGDLITVVKSMEVSTKVGGNMTFKRISPTCRLQDQNGEVRDISGRCINLDAYCSEKLNVSKAILNNVIFCHQEEAAWPLDDGKNLKMRFDEIFGSANYDKCVDKLRKIVKERKANIKLLKVQYDYKDTAWKDTIKLKNQLAERMLQLDQLGKTIEENKKNVAPMQQRLDEIYKLSSLQDQLSGLMEQQSELSSNILEEYSGSDQDLMKALNDFDKFQEELKNNIQKKREKSELISGKINQMNVNIQKRQVLRGQLKQEAIQHQEHCKTYEQLIQKVKIKFNMPQLDQQNRAHTLPALKNYLSQKQDLFKKLQEDCTDKERSLQDTIDLLRVKLAESETSVKSKNKSVMDCKQTIAQLKIKVEDLKYESEKIELMNQKINSIQKDLEKKKADFNETLAKDEVETLDDQIKDHENRQVKLERDMRVLQQNYATEQKLESQHHDVSEKKLELSKLVLKHRESFKTLFGANEEPTDNFEVSVNKVLKNAEAAINSITKETTDLEKKIMSADMEIKRSSELLDKYNHEVEENKKKIDEVCIKGLSFTDTLNQSSTRKEQLHKKRGAYHSAKVTYEDFIDQFKQPNPCCPVCDTNFNSSKSSAVSKIIQNLQTRIENIPNKLHQVENELAKEEELSNKLQQLTITNDNIEILTNGKIPLVEIELDCHKSNVEKLKQDLREKQNELSQPQNVVQIGRSILKDAVIMDRLSQDIHKLLNLISITEFEMVTVSSNQSLSNIESELATLRAELSTLRVQHRNKRDLYDERKNQLHKLNDNLQREISRKMLAENQTQQLPIFQKQIEDNEESVTRFIEEIQTLNESVALRRAELVKANENRLKEMTKNKETVDGRRSELEDYRRLIEDVQKLCQVMENYEQGKNQDKLEQIDKELESCNNDIRKLEQAKKVLDDSRMKDNSDLSNQESNHRNLKDNKRLREIRAKTEVLQKQINEIERVIGRNDIRELEYQLDRQRAEINRMIGEQITLKRLIEQNEVELSGKRHKEAETECIKKYYELRVHELGVQDLEVYNIALEKAVLQFHQEKMVQINITIRELWRNIYRGNDIDYIEIKTDGDIGTAGASRRTYQYRVVQIKNGVELSMKGRCSAGQKVLACLVIRIALAETFSANCGILALDEPTTNLDHANIMSLSDALNRIITSRQNQKNFQLLVITHDEEFLRILTRDQSVSTYYRVERSAEGFSRIKQETLY